ncbi:DNA-directed RNA polymerase III subunit RPC6 isoform X2 [Anarhichas minor]|uniref:DNA-directed RNA polymerase III subunit RPC6 isoform X2 n=1 Tax=Anarhichas minor TaxID=65739 RepID=UPI003F731D65
MSEVKLKKETNILDVTELENRIKELCQQFPHGITDQVIQNDMPHLEPQQRAMAINKLLSLGQLDLLRNSSGLLYRMKDTQSNSKMKGSDNQEKLVYQVIEDAGNKGIWSRDIRFKSNLPLTEVNKILKNLESKKLIKAVKSVAASKKKVYMLYNLQPDRSVTGGAWYSDQDFESEFVEVLNQQCFKFLQSKAEAARDSKQSPMVQRNSSFATSHEVWKYICELGISKACVTGGLVHGRHRDHPEHADLRREGGDDRHRRQGGNGGQRGRTDETLPRRQRRHPTNRPRQDALRTLPGV